MAWLISGLLLLAATWLGPLPGLARSNFWAHMTMHMIVVAVAAPMVAAGLAATRWDPAERVPWACAPIPSSIVELVVVWMWHVPALHHAARHGTLPLVLEQSSFLIAGVLLWSSALGAPGRGSWRAAAGAGALLFTSIHMTLLGALFALGRHPLYHHAGRGMWPPLDDQHLGGAIMLLVGGASYMAGGLWLIGRVLRPGPSSFSVTRAS
jgi:putative membrane protein